MQVRSHLHPAVRLVDGLLHSQAVWGTERDTADVGRLHVGLQQSSTGPGKSESQIGEYFHVKSQVTYYINRVKDDVCKKTTGLRCYGTTICLWIDEKGKGTHIFLYGLWMVYTFHSLTSHNSLFLVAEGLWDMEK